MSTGIGTGLPARPAAADAPEAPPRAARPPDARPRTDRARDALLLAGAAAAALLCATVVAYLVAKGRPELALGLLLAVPAAIGILRYPLAAVAIWLVVTPFLVATDGGAIRMVYWLVHRALPVIALLNLVIGAWLGARRTRPSLGWPEAAMVAYLALSQLSILFASADVLATTYHLYDRVFIPMCLYLIVRLAEPDERDLRRLVPIAVYLLVSQAAIGILQWAAPQVLPGAWLERIGLRTTGSLSHANVYGTTMLFAGLILLYAGMSRTRAQGRWRLLALFPASLVLVVLTYSRASWLAGLVVLLGLFAIHPRYVTNLVLVGIVIGVALFTSGRIDQQVQLVQQRFRSERSEESALSRLPVMAASVRMFQERPLLGWGYGNFDRYDRQFQGAVGDLVVPQKDHASHNLYLTILAEQGVLGLFCFLAPAAWWLTATRRAWRTRPAGGPLNRNLFVILWLVLVAHVVVNNYSNMRVVYGLGLWWLTLGIIAALVTRYRPAPTGVSAGRWVFVTRPAPMTERVGRP